MGGQPHGFFGHFPIHPGHLVEDEAGPHYRHPALRPPLPFPHAGFRRFLGEGLIRKDPNPDLAAPFHVAGDGDPGRLDLLGRDPAAFLGHEAEIPEGHEIAPGGLAPATASHDLPMFYPFWTQHCYFP